MESLSAIIDSLSVGEVKLVRHFFKLRNYGEHKKRAELFDVIHSKKACDNQEAAKLLGYSSNIGGFKNLKKRLRNDVLCVLLMQECSSKYSTPYAQATFDCRRSLIQGEMLMSRGVYDEALEMLGKASKLASKFELFAEALQIDDLRRNHMALRDNGNGFEETSRSIEENYTKLGQLMSAKKSHYEINTPQLLGVGSLDEYVEKGKSLIGELDKTKSAACSSRVNLYHHLASMNYYSSVHDFEHSENHAIDLLKAIENDPVVYSKSNQAGVNMEMANIYLNTSKYEKAIQHATKAVELFKPGMINQLHAYMILFFSFFRNDDSKNAGRILNTALNHRLVKNEAHPLMVSRLQLLRAALSFKEGDYEESSFILRQNSEQVRDKEAWMPGYFLLESLILLEKKSVDIVSYRVEAFRKMTERNSQYKEERRMSAITRILRQLVKEDGNYRKISPSGNKDIRLLADAKEQYYWNPTGYEVIRFDEWLLKKVS